ncbi:hypothetical protein FRC07_000230, partial [Ceratobasidium sp. 392]
MACNLIILANKALNLLIVYLAGTYAEFLYNRFGARPQPLPAQSTQKRSTVRARGRPTSNQNQEGSTGNRSPGVEGSHHNAAQSPNCFNDNSSSGHIQGPLQSLYGGNLHDPREQHVSARRPEAVPPILEDPAGP